MSSSPHVISTNHVPNLSRNSSCEIIASAPSYQQLQQQLLDERKRNAALEEKLLLLQRALDDTHRSPVQPVETQAIGAPSIPSRENRKFVDNSEVDVEGGEEQTRKRSNLTGAKATAMSDRYGLGKWTLSDDGCFRVAAPENMKFVEYYKEQQIMTEEEWPAFMDSLQTKLPTTFRLSTINGMHYDLLHELTHGLQTSSEINKAGGPESYTYSDADSGKSFIIEPPTPLTWYPNSLGWYIRAGRGELKTKGNKFEAFRKFLMHHNDQGNLNQQEAVSMIPPLLLDVQPHHIVLDMCAAPGSKTAQLLETLHGGVDGANHQFNTPSGMVVANDADYKRAYLLVHQLKRYGSSAFLVTTHDGQQFPNLYERDESATVADATASAAAAVSPAAAPAVIHGDSSLPSSTQTAAAFHNPMSTLYGAKQVQFDRILADVPCSGDGTLRKNVNLWTIWDTKFANGLHFLQLMIACRALEMLKVGGLMVYSTCSFNPIENESVVAELLRRAGGFLEIVDVSDKLSGLIRRPGLTNWKVRDAYEERWADANEETIKSGQHKTLRPSMFPPTAEEIKQFHLERCMRILPQAQDTGGVFITLLRKTGETPHLKSVVAVANRGGNAAAISAAAAGLGTDPSNSTSSTGAANAGASSAAPTASASPEAVDDGLADSVLAELPDLDDPDGSNSHKTATKMLATKDARFNEDPFEPMPRESVSKILDFYGLAHDGVDHSNFFTRSDLQRKCYFVAPAIARILNCARNSQKLKIVHTGSRCYERGTRNEDETYPCHYRIVQEGVESVLPFMRKQILTPSFESSMALLYRFAWPYEEMDREGKEEKFFKEIIAHKNGCVVLIIKGEDIAKFRTTYTTIEQALAGSPFGIKQEASSSSSSSASASSLTRRSIPICVWKTPHSVSLMIAPSEQKALLHLLDPEGKLMPEAERVKRAAVRAAELAKEAERKAKQEEYLRKQQQYKEEAAAAAAATSSANVPRQEFR